MGTEVRRLVIAPHVDDDVIGCGGVLDEDAVVFYCGVDDFHEVDAVCRFLEAREVALSSGVHEGARKFYWPNPPEVAAHEGYLIVEQYPCARLVNAYDIRSLVQDLERVICAERPNEVLLPWPSYNQDHRAVYEAAMVALRPHDRNQFVPHVLLYEEPDCFWPMLGAPFVPNLFRPIDIERKLHLYSLMPSQVRGMRSPEHLRALARVRGAACNVDYAEAYHILRWVE